MNGKTFEKYYKLLNSEQKEAVDTIEGPVMVIAGPGTGKTQILTLRIANILKCTDTAPQNILALTFTESATYSMRRRLMDIIGSASYRVNIFTFHAFCNDLIKRFPEYFPRIIGSRNITQIDQIKIVEGIITETKLKLLKPFGDPLYYLRSVIKSIGTLKKENISPKRFAELIKKRKKEFYAASDLYHDSGVYEGKMKGKYLPVEKQLEKNEELALIYQAYEKRLAELKVYDYDDMIMEVIRVLEKNSDLLSALQEEYQYILVDEHQDTNSAQNKVVELLCNFYEAPNLFVVGDEKQAIFRFQGADLDNFFYFRRLYPKAKLISLQNNYRSTQLILDSAHSLITKGGGDLNEFRKNLKSAGRHKEERIKLGEFSEAGFEYKFLSEDIKRLIKNKVSPAEIAVLYRDNKDVFNIIKEFEKNNIKYVVESDESLLEDNDIQKLTLIFKAINSFGEDDLLLQMLHIDFLEVKSLDIYKLIIYKNANKVKTLLEVLKNKKYLENVGVEEPEKLNSIYERLSNWHRQSKNENLADFFNIVVNSSDFIKHILNGPAPIDKMAKLNGLFDEVKSLVENNRRARLRDLVERLDLLEEHNILVKKIIKGAEDSSRVKLMTAHKSKGLEFDYVYIVNSYDSHWGNRKNKEPLRLLMGKNAAEGANDNDDERRLFYVALTRGRKGVTITYAKKGHRGEDQLRSQFVEEIDANLIEAIDVAAYEEKFAKEINKFEVSVAEKKSVKDKEYLNGLFKERGLSVTALNNYLACPWRYFYNNLVRIPTAIEKTQMYGIAIHAAFKIFFDKWKKGEEADKKLLLDLFNSSIQYQPLSQKDLEEAMAKGEKALGGYYDAYFKTWSREIINEFNIPGVILGDVILTGTLDKLEKAGVDNLGRTEVVVYDYKTAKPKSRNEIDGNTKNSDGNYKRQLIFYNLLLNMHDGGKYKMTQGVIDFIEPDDKGRYKREAFIIQESEIKELIETIERVSKEILDLEFWNKRCSDKKCEYCKLRQLLK